MSTNGINQQVVEAFTGRMLDVLNSGSLALMTSIGHRTGLFDTMTELPPATSSQIAEATGLQERYVREWLGAMVVGRIVEYDSDSTTYHLPREHAAALTRAAAPNNLAAFMQYIGLLGSVEDGIVESFRNGGGVPYSAYPRFQDVMAEDSGQSVLPALLDHILPLVPGLVEALQRGIEVLDLGCGRGKALILMAENFPNSRFTGYDFSENGIAAARAEAQQKGLSNLRFEVQDAAKLGESQRYDLITTFDAIHDQAKPAAVLSNIQRALKAEGVYLMQDISGSSHVHNNLDHPMGQFLYTVSCMHCMTVSLAYGGDGLGAMWGREKALQMLAEAGFAKVEVKQLAHDVQNDYYICRKG
ncbi:MAG TPA: class I SAM-dependent methyltransferase [Anaerolineae bacterium]|nr:class I SAM-dependent methyltransferase [Anaerolineae bacterium]